MNGFSQIMQMLNTMKNPQQMVAQMLQNNPNARAFLSQMQNQAQGRSPKDMAIQLARQNGINEQQLMQMVNKINCNL